MEVNITYNAFSDYPEGKRAVISYSHYYHEWMIVNEAEEYEWDARWWEAVRYKNSFHRWAYVDNFIAKE